MLQGHLEWNKKSQWIDLKSRPQIHAAQKKKKEKNMKLFAGRITISRQFLHTLTTCFFFKQLRPDEETYKDS
jgi:hypothetical protein